jgi:transposase
MLEAAPELEAKALFDHFLLSEECCGEVQEEHLRTFQRRVLQWRLQHGPDKEVYFPQDRSPGHAVQLDWTHAAELGIGIGGQRYDHLLCHVVLPYSNWQWATRCQSESLLSLRHGLQEALQRLGKVPVELQVDNSTAATHQIASGLTERTFNKDFVSICEHYGLTPRTINIECPNENGDVESANGHLKRRLTQHLLLRGSREFSSEAHYEDFLGQALNRANARRAKAVGQELALMRPLPPTRLSEYEEVYCPVSKYSTIRVKKVGYSVPARLIGQEVKVEVSENQLQIYFGRELLFTVPRECGRGVVLDYRHVIDHLLRKPGAFERYRYREELFLSPLFRQAYDQLIAKHGQRPGTVEYLRLLKLTSETNLVEVEMMLVEYTCPPYPAWSVEALRQLLLPRASTSIQLTELQPNCQSYDALLSSSQEVPHV